MFSTKLTFALAGLGLAAALQAAAALWSIGVADRQVLRGRVASDIHVAFVELSVTKQRLRSWVAQRQADAGADAAQRDALLDEMRGTLRHLDRLARQAPDGGGAGDAAADATQRAEAVAALERGVAALDRASRGVEPLAADADARPAWQALSEQFARPDGLVVPVNVFDGEHFPTVVQPIQAFDVIVVIGHNDDPVVPGAGSAIFLHLARPGGPEHWGAVL